MDDTSTPTEPSAPPRLSDEAFQAVAQHVDQLVQEFESLPLPQVREQVFALLQGVDALHREGLTRLVEGVRAADPAALARVARDPAVQTLLVLYDLSDQPLPSPAAPPASGAFIPRDQIRRPRRSSLVPAGRLEELPEGTAKGVEVAGRHLLLANVDGTVHAVADRCPGSAALLSLGTFSPPIVICPWHNDAFDVRSGARVDGSRGPQLEVVPVVIEGGQILVRLSGEAPSRRQPR